MRSSMKKALFVGVAAVLVATAVGGLAPVVGADPADYPVTLFPSGAASPFSITQRPTTSDESQMTRGGPTG